MINAKSIFSGFSVNDLGAAKKFYNDTLGLKLTDQTMGLHFELPSDGELFIYEKADHQPATFTILNFVVENIDSEVDGLVNLGVKFEIYEGMPAKQDEKGILRGLSANQGPDIAWFKDPAGNILSIIQAS